MKKYKYQRLSKKEKNEAKLAFFQAKQDLLLKKRFNRILICGIILILYGIYLMMEAYIEKDSTAQLVYGIILIIFGIAFLITRSYVQMRKVNDFITIKKKK